MNRRLRSLNGVPHPHPRNYLILQFTAFRHPKGKWWLHSTVWCFILSSHCASLSWWLSKVLRSSQLGLTDRPMHTHTHTDTHSLSLSKTLEEQWSGKCCSMLKGIRKICKCSSWLLHVRIAAVAGGLRSDSDFFFFLNRMAIFFFLLPLAFLGRPAEANVRQRLGL